MNWIDIRVRKPEEKDANDEGEVLVFRDGKKATRVWDEVDSDLWPHWYPLSDLPDPPARIPDPPEGYRFKQDGDKRTQESLSFDPYNKHWVPVKAIDGDWREETAYAVPIAPPKPQYRAFANADEFEPFADRWVRCKPEKCETYRIYAYNDQLFWMGTAVEGVSFEEGLRDYCFSDGAPFGLPV